MAQGRGKALRQGTPISKSRQPFSESEIYSPSPFKREIFLDYDQWQNIAEDRLPWYEYNHGSGDRKKAASDYLIGFAHQTPRHIVFASGQPSSSRFQQFSVSFQVSQAHTPSMVTLNILS
jgi:hypothetical protein